MTITPQLAQQCLEALESAKFMLDAAIGMHLIKVPDDADGPVVQIPAAISALREALASGEGDEARDAARYRWLREQLWTENTLAVVLRPKDNTKLGCFLPFGELLDNTIDLFNARAAMKGNGT